MGDHNLVLLEFLNPENLIRYGGLLLLAVILFAESGVFFCFFLPGDSLLFTAGLLSGSDYLPHSVFLVIPVLIAASLTGSITGYYSGRWARHLLPKGDNFFLKKKYMDMTEEFYKQHGMFAFIIGKFLPIIRTFVTILAGVVRIDFNKFLGYNILGTTVWITSLVLAGHFLGRAFPQTIDYLEIIVILMIVITAIPPIMVWLRSKRTKDSA
ncbi:MAG: DedA family protein [Cyclobacteriaceae bacterium]|nr:DedA family protein [Cyclobacteriaceae bacterium]